MKEYKKDDNTHLVDLGIVIVHNYPPDKNTYSYCTRLFRETSLNDNAVATKLIDGEPIYLHEASEEIQRLAIIQATTNAALSKLLPEPKYKAWNPEKDFIIKRENKFSK